MNKPLLLLTLGLYVISSVASFAAFSVLDRGAISITPGGSSVSGNEDPTGPTRLGVLLNIDPSAPRDQECPLSGALYTQAEKEAWEKRRPLAVMIENSPDARPQSGLADADIIFEAVAEGGVTRFMGMFYCGVQAYDTTLAPIRSARTYFIDWASGFNLPLYVHVGGANTPGPSNALGQINEYGWALQNDLNQFSIGFPTFVRNANRLNGKSIATEHTMETTTEKLWAVAEKRNWTNMSPDRKTARGVIPGTDWKDGFKPWVFENGKPGAGSTTTVSYGFWSGYNQYSVEWHYNSQTNSYARVMASEPHVDLNTGDQIHANNVVVLFSDEKGPINEQKHLLYKTTGTGDALIFKNGEVLKATWSKPKRESELRFVDSKGADIPFVRGMTWISVLDPSFKVTY